MLVYLFIIVLSLSWPCLGQVKKARISVQLAHAICGQFAVFESTNVLQPAVKKPSSSLLGEVIWQECRALKHCEPFSFSVDTGSKDNQRVNKYIAEDLFPNLAALEIIVSYETPGVLVGHGLLLNSRLIITAASSFSLDILSVGYYTSLYKPISGSLKRFKNWNNKTRLCTFKLHPKYDRTTNAYNFALVFFKNDVISPDKIRNVTFAKQGQTFNGPCKYQSWGKLDLLHGIYSYSDDLMEAKLKILPSHECAAAGFPSTHICTPPVLCGFQDSGAPLVCSDNNAEYIVGLSSHYNMNYDDPIMCGGNVLSSFTSVTAIDWDWVDTSIQKYLEACQQERPTRPPWPPED